MYPVKYHKDKMTGVDVYVGVEEVWTGIPGSCRSKPSKHIQCGGSVHAVCPIQGRKYSSFSSTFVAVLFDAQ